MVGFYIGDVGLTVARLLVDLLESLALFLSQVIGSVQVEIDGVK